MRLVRPVSFSATTGNILNTCHQTWEHGIVISAAQPTIQVVTAGTDWAAIVAAIVTGLAAIIGIGGTALQANAARKASAADLKTSVDAATTNQQANIEAAAENMRVSIEAEDMRALRAEKIRVYSEFQGAIDNLLVRESIGSAQDAVAVIYRSAAVVSLIAPGDIGRLSRDLARTCANLIGDFIVSKDTDPISDKRVELYDLMRADLGTDKGDLGMAHK